MEPADLILEPGAGARIQETFADARWIANEVLHTVIVRGNDVEVEVLPGMSDDACRVAYEAALMERDAPTTPVSSPYLTAHDLAIVDEMFRARRTRMGQTYPIPAPGESPS